MNYLAFLSVAVATIAGTLLAFLMVPMRSLGQDNWKIAAALLGSYIGGGQLILSTSIDFWSWNLKDGGF